MELHRLIYHDIDEGDEGEQIRDDLDEVSKLIDPESLKFLDNLAVLIYKIYE